MVKEAQGHATQLSQPCYTFARLVSHSSITYLNDGESWVQAWKLVLEVGSALLERLLQLSTVTRGHGFTICFKIRMSI